MDRRPFVVSGADLSWQRLANVGGEEWWRLCGLDCDTRGGVPAPADHAAAVGVPLLHGRLPLVVESSDRQQVDPG